MKIEEINVLVLAYLGDTIYENFIRYNLILQENSNVDRLQKKAIKYVSAKGQAFFLKKMINCNFLCEEELRIVKRARNYKTTSHPKNCDIITYKYATGLEALLGYLKLENRCERIDEIMNFIFGCEIC